MKEKINEPEWLKKSRNDTDDLKSNIFKLENEGHADIRIGLMKVKKANELKKDAYYIESTLEKLNEPTLWNDELIRNTGTMVNGSIVNLSQYLTDLNTYGFVGSRADEIYFHNLEGTLTSTDMTSGSAVYLCAKIETRIQQIQPTNTPIYQQEPPFRIASRKKIYQDLLEIISEFGEKYTNMVKGSELGLENDNPDHLSQAANSMRDCFEQLLQQLAPNKVVKQQTWFEFTDGAPGGVSRSSRLKFILLGPGGNNNPNQIDLLEKDIDNAIVILNLAIKNAHDHKPGQLQEDVTLAIDQARHVLLGIIKKYKLIRAYTTKE